MSNFSAESSIHGVNLVFNKNKSKFVRISWCLLLVLSFCGNLYYLYNSFIKFKFSPDIAIKKIERKSTDFPMSALTFCPKIFTNNKTKIYQPPTNKSQCELHAANMQWCDFDYISMIEPFCKEYDLENINVMELVNESAFTDYLTAFAYDHDYGLSILTSAGYCFSINIQPKEIYNEDVVIDAFKLPSFQNFPNTEWTVEKGYFSKNSGYPFRINRERNYGFYFDFKSEDILNVCNSMVVILHLPNEIPTIYHKTIPISFKYRTYIDVTAVSHRTDESLREYPPEVRKCYFDGERKLKLFKTYSKAHCELECKINDTILNCDCVLFWMPRDNATKVCTLNGVKCARNMFETQMFRNVLFCNCLPPCHEIKYDFYANNVINYLE